MLNDQLFDKIKKVYNKNNCYDLFNDIKVDGTYMYEPLLQKKRVNLKFNKISKSIKYKKLEIIPKLGAVKITISYDTSNNQSIKV